MQIQKGKIEIAGGEQSFVLQYLSRIILLLFYPIKKTFGS
jgi:hypothetical protein